MPGVGQIRHHKLKESADAAELAPDVSSFYHLSTADISSCACQGLACFVARRMNAERWDRACVQACRLHCLGRCYNAPAEGSDDSFPTVFVDSPQAIVLGRLISGGATDLDQYRRVGGYSALSKARSCSPEQVIAEVEASGLRGRGGAGFPTGRKWRAAAQASGTTKYVVTNADEGDPGAYIDRFLLERDPHVILEAMAIAARAVGASRGIVYIRREYPAAATSMRQAIEQARAAGILGLAADRDKGAAFDVQVHVGRGSYLCGEETALLNALEARRPVATARPPYATEWGLFGQPTVINNVETLASVPWIIAHGGAAYSRMGAGDSRGTKVVSLNSLFVRPGLYEVEFGIPVRRIVETLGGGLRSGVLRGVLIGAPLAGVLPPHLLDTPFTFEHMRAVGASVGHGGVVAFDEHTSILELMRHIFAFGADESCGKCAPCRLGTRRIQRILEGVIARGAAPAEERNELNEIVAALQLASLCGHGTGLAEFAASVLRYYEPEVDAWFA